MQEEPSTQPQVEPTPAESPTATPLSVLTDPVVPAPTEAPAAVSDVPPDLVLGEPEASVPETAQTVSEVVMAPVEVPAQPTPVTPPLETAVADPAPVVETPLATPETSSEPVAPQDIPTTSAQAPEQTLPSTNESILAPENAAKPVHRPIAVIVVAAIVFMALSAAALYLYFKK